MRIHNLARLQVRLASEASKEKCILPVSATQIDQRELVTLQNPNYPELLTGYPHLKGVQMEDTSTKETLPIHVILGANDYTKTKMACYQRARAMESPYLLNTPRLGGQSFLQDLK